jgi:hypothetical protein
MEFEDPNVEIARTLYNGSSLLRALGFARANHGRLRPGTEYAILGFFVEQIRQNGYNVEFAPREYFDELGKDPRDLATWVGNTLVLDYELTKGINSLRAKDEMAHELGVRLAEREFGSRQAIPLVQPWKIWFTHFLDRMPWYREAA